MTIDSINSIKKPYTAESNKIAAELLWSQPNIFKEDYTGTNFSSQFRKLSFSQENLNSFLLENKLILVIRSKDVSQSGMDRIFNMKLISIFSATNYGGTMANDGAILYVKRNLEIKAKLMTTDENMNTWNSKKELVAAYPLSPKKKEQK